MLFAAACLAPAALLAQNTPAAPAPAANAAASAEEDVFTLSVFEVRSVKDEGYRTENSIGTTGFAQKLMDTPLTISVFTAEFLKDTGKEGFLGALAYAGGVSLDANTPNGNYSPGAGRGNGQGNYTRFRGQPFAGTFRNGLRQFYGFSTEDADRIEVAKGPMAVFVGGATIGGEVNNVTRKPLFDSAQELTVKVGSHETVKMSLDATGAVDAGKTFAYRMLLSAAKGNKWQQDSEYSTWLINPQLLWRPNSKFSTRLELIRRTEGGNAVSQPQPASGNYQAAFDAPPQSLLDLGKLRTTGTGAGLPFTVAEYRSRIGYGGFGQWRTDMLNTTGQWTALGVGDTLSDGYGPGGRSYNFFGPNAGYSVPFTLLESETNFSVTDWLDLSLIGRHTDAHLNYNLYSFGTRLQPAGYYQSNNYSANRTHAKNRDLKLQGVLTKNIWRSRNILLLGAQYGDDQKDIEDAVLNYAAYPLSVALSPFIQPNTINPLPTTLTGANAWIYWDPRANPFPDNRLITIWPTETYASGVKALSYSKSITRAEFAALSSSWFDNRVTLTAGKRYSWGYSSTVDRDRYGSFLPGGSSSPNVRTSNYSLGAVVQLLKGINLYASQNQGESYRAGSLVGRVSFAPASVPLNIVTPEEQAANPVPNSIGKGKEVGLKFDVLDHTLTGSFGWFTLTNGNVLITDALKNSKDPRNVGTEADLNPATSNPAVRASVNWLTPIDGNTTEGFETDWIWTPSRSYSLRLGASHLTKNRPTVIKLPTNSVALDINYWLLKDRPLPNSPDNIINLFQHYVVTSGALKGASVGFGVNYQSSQQPAADNTAWGLVFPSYTVYNLTLGYSRKVFGHKVDWQLQVDNLANHKYFTGNRVFGAPREFTLSATTRF